MTFPKTPEWENIISRLLSEERISCKAEHILTDVKSMLASRQPHTVARLKSLGWPDTTAAGVYAYIGKLNRKSARKIGNVYIGSASEHRGGLRTRRLNTLLPSPLPSDDSFKCKIKDLDLSQDGEFITLCIVPFKDDSSDGVANVKALVILTRAVLTIWLTMLMMG